LETWEGVPEAEDPVEGVLEPLAAELDEPRVEDSEDVFQGDPDILDGTVPNELPLEAVPLGEVTEIDPVELNELFVIGDTIAVLLEVVAELLNSGMVSATETEGVSPEFDEAELEGPEVVDGLPEDPVLIDEE